MQANGGTSKLWGGRVTAVVLLLFGVLTLAVGGSVLFDLGDARAQAGNYVAVVVWVNFLAAFLYVSAAFGMFNGKGWPASLLVVALALLIIGAIGLGIHVQQGKPFEARTFGALTFRIFVTFLFYVAARYYNQRRVPGAGKSK